MIIKIGKLKIELTYNKKSYKQIIKETWIKKYGWFCPIHGMDFSDNCKCPLSVTK